MEDGVFSLNEVLFMVLDEVDCMLNLGFELEVHAILSQNSTYRKMVMFNATWPLGVHQLAKYFMDLNPINVVVFRSQDLDANHDMMQIVEVLDDQERD
eukprot:Gb_34267 [translate_table: standard]